jgi:hypothetical protein
VPDLLSVSQTIRALEAAPGIRSSAQHAARPQVASLNAVASADLDGVSPASSPSCNRSGATPGRSKARLTRIFDSHSGDHDVSTRSLTQAANAGRAVPGPRSPQSAPSHRLLHWCKHRHWHRCLQPGRKLRLNARRASSDGPRDGFARYAQAGEDGRETRSRRQQSCLPRQTAPTSRYLSCGPESVKPA